MTEQKKKDGLNIELSEEVAEGSYSNLAIINHSASEFVLDFIRVLPGMAKAKVKSRVIMSPMHVKTLMFALQDNINKFENKFGEIKVIKKEGSNEPQFKLPDDVLPN